MKNRFFVINKEKIYAYVVSIMTIVTIFFMTSMINTDLKETEEVSSNDIQNSAIGEAVSTSVSNIEENNTVEIESDVADDEEEETTEENAE